MKRSVIALAVSLFFSAGVFAAENKRAGSEYTYETVSMYGESWDFVIRWDSGTVRVVDETGTLEKNPALLELLNMNLGATKLVLVTEAKSDILIKFVDELPAPYGNNGCGLSQSKLAHDGAKVVEAIIRIKKDSSCSGPKNSVHKNEALVLHELGHALGFAKHAKENDVMSVHDASFEKKHVNIETLQRFLKGLYSLDVGAKIPGSKRMPDPLPNSFTYDVAVNASETKDLEPEIKGLDKGPDKGPDKAPDKAPDKGLDKAPIVESNVIVPTQKYRKIEKRDAQGRLTWEFIPEGGVSNVRNAGNVVEIGPSKKTPRFESIGPRENSFSPRR